MTITRDEIALGKLTLTRAVIAEIEKARAAGDLQLTTSPRCYVCVEVESKELVNRLIAVGMTNREITECCEGINERRTEKGDKRLIHAYNVRWHRRWHFNVQRPTQAAYREIVERRAEEVNRDHINGIGHAITTLATLEAAMVKGFEDMVEHGAPVSVMEMITAASRLHEFLTKDANRIRVADLQFQMDGIIRAAQEFIPEELHQAFVARVEGKAAPPVHVVVESAPAIREFTVPFTRDDDDEDE
jgi:hypothetical protein